MRADKRARVLTKVMFALSIVLFLSMLAICVIFGFNMIPALWILFSMGAGFVCADSIRKRTFGGTPTTVLCLAGSGILITFALIMNPLTFTWGVLLAMAGIIGGVTVKNAAADRDHNSVLWFVFGFIVFPFALIIAMLMKPVQRKSGEITVGKISRLHSSRAFSRVEPWLYLLPFMIGRAVFTIYPVINVILMSFKEDYSYLTRDFAKWGFENYKTVLTDDRFTQGLRNTLVYVACVVPISTAIAVVVAYLLNQKIKGIAFFQTAFFMPMVTSVTAVGLSWKLMFNKNFGIINYFLSWFGVDAVNWLDNADWGVCVATLVIFGIWNILPFTIILLLSGLQNIDEQYYTAARIDGAKSGRIFFRITVPLLAPTIFLVCIVNTISTFKVFSELYPLFKGNPGPYNNLYTVVYYIRYVMMQDRAYGIAAAGAIILFLFIFAFTMIQLAVQKYSRKRLG